eukprot:CAMPEP_0171434148 /NCGR_PEP_ID=MMETSP0881-20121228/8981_1 /TAXON_ID=67004 /ORGANISM="Thalassiosira weissflogii, Strain CCMP1336" /LENGTH=32 /DNA_ID= /DNA_START= /DNA_END= /DNA_ORIENTATION=
MEATSVIFVPPAASVWTGFWTWKEGLSNDVEG